MSTKEIEGEYYKILLNEGEKLTNSQEHLGLKRVTSIGPNNKRGIPEAMNVTSDLNEAFASTKKTYFAMGVGVCAIVGIVGGLAYKGIEKAVNFFSAKKNKAIPQNDDESNIVEVEITQNNEEPGQEAEQQSRQGKIIKLEKGVA